MPVASTALTQSLIDQPESVRELANLIASKKERCQVTAALADRSTWVPILALEFADETLRARLLVELSGKRHRPFSPWLSNTLVSHQRQIELALDYLAAARQA